MRCILHEKSNDDESNDEDVSGLVQVTIVSRQKRIKLFQGPLTGHHSSRTTSPYRAIVRQEPRGCPFANETSRNIVIAIIVWADTRREATPQQEPQASLSLPALQNYVQDRRGTRHSRSTAAPTEANVQQRHRRKWYDIYTILFANHQHPHSLLIEAGHPAELRAYMDVTYQRSPDILLW